MLLCPQSVKSPELQRTRVLQEMGTMLRVQHHPHAVKLLDAYEDSKGYQLVMQMLQGQLATPEVDLWAADGSFCSSTAVFMCCRCSMWIIGDAELLGAVT